MSYQEKENIKIIKNHLFDPLFGEYIQKDFEDLNWIDVSSLRKPNDSGILSEPFIPKYTYDVPDEMLTKNYLWLLKSALNYRDYEERDVRLRPTHEAIHNNMRQESGMIMDGCWYTHYAEIPSKEYMYKKFYADKYDSIEAAEEALIKKMEKYYRDQEKIWELNDKKNKAIDNATFFAQALLDNVINIELNFRSFPVICKDKEIGRGTLVEYKDNKIHIAVKLNNDSKNVIDLNGKSIQCEYDTDTKVIDNIESIVKINKMIIDAK